jgi:hypothetical protein
LVVVSKDDLFVFLYGLGALLESFDWFYGPLHILDKWNLWIARFFESKYSTNLVVLRCRWPKSVKGRNLSSTLVFPPSFTCFGFNYNFTR